MKNSIRNIGLVSVFIIALGIFLLGFQNAKCGLDREKLPVVTVFAAASLTDAITEVSNNFKSEQKAEVRLSFASSSTLARQISSGASPDVYLSANVKWMNYLDEKSRIIKSTRINLLNNRLVVISPVTIASPKITMNKSYDFGSAFKGRLAMGDPDHVPAGMYGKQALMNMGWFEKINTRIAPAMNVRKALMLVETGETECGIVYATDATRSDKVKVVATFPENSHKKITYVAAAVTSEKDGISNAAKAFLGYLQSDKAKTVFEKYGFTFNR